MYQPDAIHTVITIVAAAIPVLTLFGIAWYALRRAGRGR
jgi:hypothetical protein